MCEDRSADEWMIDHQPVFKRLFVTLLMGAAVLLAACGQVVTPEPTRDALPANTPTATLATPIPRPTKEVLSSSPPDTMTPTTTPTPIVHVVQQGDTLQAIAFDFEVSVEALQRANGVENPQFLQVGQRLVIPVDEESGQMTPGLLLPTPTPQPIRVQGEALYETPVDSLLGLGEVHNTTTITLTNVQVQVTLLNAANEPLVETNTFISADILPPGACSPFRVLFTTPPSDWASYQMKVIRGQEAGALARGYVPMSVVKAEGSLSDPQLQVNGVVKNVSTGQRAQSVDVIVTTYDAEGRVTGFRQSVLTTAPRKEGAATPSAVDGGLPPGGEIAFSLSLTTHGDVPAGRLPHFIVLALGHAVDSTTSGG